jgi:hypothetical protein
VEGVVTITANTNPDQNRHMDDTQLHHLFDLIRARRLRLSDRHGYTDTYTGRNMDDDVYAADDAGHIELLTNGRCKPTEAGQRWRDTTPRPSRAHPDSLFHNPAQVT